MNKLIEAKEGFERRYLKKLLRRMNGNVSAAAREVGIDRANFLRKLRQHKIRAKRYRKKICKSIVNVPTVANDGKIPFTLGTIPKDKSGWQSLNAQIVRAQKMLNAKK